jgi:hypothetical protein
VGLLTLHHKNKLVTTNLTEPRTWTDSLDKRPKLRNLGEVGWGDADWICLAQDRNRWRAQVNSVLNLRVPRNAGKLSSGLTSSGLSGSAQIHIVS